MQFILNKIGECKGCVFFNQLYDHVKCGTCERNPRIMSVLKDNRSVADRNLLPEGVFEEGPDSPLRKMADANASELGAAGLTPDAIARMQRDHDRRGSPRTRPRR